MKSRFRPDIEGLRAVAVLAVMAYHFSLGPLHGGFTGVDVFFVISGYLITALLMNQQEYEGRIDMAAFWGRRARRLLPAMLLVTLCTLLASMIILSPFEQLRAVGSAGASSLFAANFWLLLSGLDYFSPDNEANPFLHMWTLSVEEQFYFCWPLLLTLLAWLKLPARRVTIVMAAFTLLSLCLCIWLTRLNQPWAFFASPARAWEFGAGGLACMVPAAWCRPDWRAAALGWCGAAILLVCFCAIPEAGFPSFLALAPVTGAFCIILSGAGNNPPMSYRLLAHPVLR